MKVIRWTFFRAKCRYGGEVSPDMLRYDIAFVNDEEPGVVVLPTFKNKYGNLGGKPTYDRWRSFGITLALEKNHEPIWEPGKWYTMRHPKAASGMINYSELERVPLIKYLDAKDIYDL